METPTVFHLPVCPYAQRIEILLELKNCPEAISFRAINVCAPMPADVGVSERGLPVLVLPSGEAIADTLAMLDWVERSVGDLSAPARCNVAGEARDRLIALSEPFAEALRALLLNRVLERRVGLVTTLLDRYAELDDVLNTYSPVGLFVGDRFGFCDALYAPLFQRMWLLQYYENFELPATSRYGRVARWQSACASYPMTQQVRREQLIKLNYDHAMGAANGALPPGRVRSSLSLMPHWSERPWPPREKYSYAATDAVLGLVYGDLDAEYLRV